MKQKLTVIICLILIMFISISNIYLISNSFLKQFIWYLIGFALIFIISKINIRIIFKYSLYLYLFGNICLLLTLLIGKSINGSSAWLSLGFISFQPSEFMKIFLILYLREITLKYDLNDFKYIIFTLIITLIPSILTFLEPDTGGVVIFFLIWFTFLIMKKISVKYYIIGISSLLLIIILFFYLYFFNQDIFINLFGTSFFYRIDRLINFYKGSGYQINSALNSISSSGFWGNKSLIYFPERTTDFAFALLISNYGLFGLSIFIIIYTTFIYNLASIKNDFYLTKPLLSILIIQYSINVLMNLGLFPIIGVPLPFLSYGGSSIISYMILVFLSFKNSFIDNMDMDYNYSLHNNYNHN